MWGIASLGPMAKRYVRFMNSLGAGQNFAPNVEKKWKREQFKRNPVTHDKERHARGQGLYAEEPRLAIAGPTIGWVAAAADCCESFQQPSGFAHVKIPVLVFTAQEEQLVDNASHAAVGAMLPNFTQITIPGAKHEILMERDDIRAQFWSGFDELANSVAPARTAAH
jgi:lysophospholipase